VRGIKGGDGLLPKKGVDFCPKESILKGLECPERGKGNEE